MLLIVAAATLQAFLSLANCKLLPKLWSARLWLSITSHIIVQICIRFSFKSNLWFAIGPTVPCYCVLSFLPRHSLQTSIWWWHPGGWREIVSLVELLLTCVDESQPALVKVIPPLHIHHHTGLLQLIASQCFAYCAIILLVRIIRSLSCFYFDFGSGWHRLLGQWLMDSGYDWFLGVDDDRRRRLFIENLDFWTTLEQLG